MQIHSSIGKFSASKLNEGYIQLSSEYNKTGFTYKSNQILHKISQNNQKIYPYELLLHICKTYHFNQFQLIFFSHILNDVQSCHNSQPQLFNQDIEISTSVNRILTQVSKKNQEKMMYNQQVEQYNIIIKSNQMEKGQEKSLINFNDEKSRGYLMISELKRVYTYLLVLGYAVKYYLNEQVVIKPYDEQIKQRHPIFFATIFNRWAKKYGNSVLATTPKKINSYYLGLAAQLQVQQNMNSNANQDCQYRNYNEIVEELVKATSQVDGIGQDYRQQ